MKLFVASLLLAAASIAQAANLPNTLEFPHKNAAPGSVYRLADHPNTVFVFEILSLGCGYCKQNAPNLDRLASDYKDHPRVQVLDMSLDSRDVEHAEWLRLFSPNHPFLVDNARRVYNALKAQTGIPQTYVVDCKGQLVSTEVGLWDAGAGVRVRGAVQKALATTCE